MRNVIVAAALFVAAVSGCSSNRGAGVEGKVTYGGEPIDVGSITFIPKSAESIKSGGLIQDGAYSVPADEGPKPGPHRVEIRWSKPTGQKSRNEFGEEITMRKEGLPDKYHTNSTLTAEIKSGKNLLDFQLDK